MAACVCPVHRSLTLQEAPLSRSNHQPCPPHPPRLPSSTRPTPAWRTNHTAVLSTPPSFQRGKTGEDSTGVLPLLSPALWLPLRLGIKPNPSPPPGRPVPGSEPWHPPPAPRPQLLPSAQGLHMGSPHLSVPQDLCSSRSLAWCGAGAGRGSSKAALCCWSWSFWACLTDSSVPQRDLPDPPPGQACLCPPSALSAHGAMRSRGREGQGWAVRTSHSWLLGDGSAGEKAFI